MKVKIREIIVKLSFKSPSDLSVFSSKCVYVHLGCVCVCVCARCSWLSLSDWRALVLPCWAEGWKQMLFFFRSVFLSFFLSAWCNQNPQLSHENCRMVCTLESCGKQMQTEQMDILKDHTDAQTWGNMCINHKGNLEVSCCTTLCRKLYKSLARKDSNSQ